MHSFCFSTVSYCYVIERDEYILFVCTKIETSCLARCVIIFVSNCLLFSVFYKICTYLLYIIYMLLLKKWLFRWSEYDVLCSLYCIKVAIVGRFYWIVAFTMSSLQQDRSMQSLCATCKLFWGDWLTVCSRLFVQWNRFPAMWTLFTAAVCMWSLNKISKVWMKDKYFDIQQNSNK